MTPKQVVFFLVFPQYLFQFSPENVCSFEDDVCSFGPQLKHRAHKPQKETGWKGSFDMTYLSALSQIGKEEPRVTGSQWNVAMNCISSQFSQIVME